MANEYKLSHTAAEIDEKLSAVGGIQSYIDVDSIANTRQNLNYLGQNPIASADEDTPEKWIALGTGHAYIYGTGKLKNQPVGYGLLENTVTGLTSFQTFTSWTDGSVRRKWTRTGQTVWSDWLMQLDEINMLDIVYPVGSVYISYEPTSPAELFGGTWTAITGVFPYFNAGTETGGSNTHTLTTAQMPAHTHSLPTVLGYQSGANNKNGGSSGGNWTSFTSSGSAGSGQSHNNMPAYQTFYAWRRTA